jgi:hypothetical protein
VTFKLKFKFNLKIQVSRSTEYCRLHMIGPGLPPPAAAAALLVRLNSAELAAARPATVTVTVIQVIRVMMIPRQARQ